MIGYIILFLLVAGVVAKIFKLWLAQGIVSTFLVGIILFGIALYYGKKTNQEQWEASNRQEQKRREREFNSGDKFVGHWLPHGGSYGLDVVKIGDGNLLVSVSKLGETIWTGKGIVQNYRLVFGGEGKGKKISGSLAYRAVSSISYELSGELTENGVLNALIVQKIE